MKIVRDWFDKKVIGDGPHGLCSEPSVICGLGAHLTCSFPTTNTKLGN